jgi:Cft2 family RNA processing exonuclease
MLTQNEINIDKQIKKLVSGDCVKKSQDQEKAFFATRTSIISQERYDTLNEAQKKAINEVLQITSTDKPEEIEFLNNVFDDFDKSKDYRLLTASFKIEKITKGKTINDRLVFSILGHWECGYVNEVENGVNTYILPKTKSLLTITNLPELLEMGVWDNKNKKLLTKYTEFETKEVEKIVKETKIVTQEKKVGVDKKQLEKAKAKVMHSWSKKWQPETVEAILNDFIKEL